MTDLVTAALRYVRSPDYCELSLRQLALLGIVADSDGPHHVRDLANEMGVAKPVVTRAVQKLKTLGLLTHARSGPDRRDCLVSATDPGRALRAAFAQENA
ncbi:DNA-binding MarR family transcriptional regulator [Sphingobium sp. JAI105]|uniref:MarR family winged helix-turn-helix transcriptional regulator n=1 Tax=Sphingobium sp. JAI105 TaxID=2787715 RepID=UPI0018CA05BB|nr:MarR family winged helix-turn-helix transcriptional regulator [Sphingobium sp. JAI105]MBG6116755.1 DNA-binding MarR family transcriptional regulator [Sphingobium sp. JAI105]